MKNFNRDMYEVLRKFSSFEKKFFEENANFVSNQNGKVVMKVYDLNTNFAFGKYEGKTLDDVFSTDPEYVQQCMITVEDFAIDERSIQKLFEKYPEIDFKDEAIDANLEKLDVLDNSRDDIFIGEEGYDTEDFEDLEDPLEKEGDFEDIEDDDFFESTSADDDWDDDDDFR